MDQDLVSIIIPAYNVDKYIEKCLDSVLAQSYQNIEVLVTDDGSTDRTGEIIDHYAEKDARITAIHFPENRGVVTARKVGTEKASGEYVAFVDADDWVEKDYLQDIMQVLSDRVDILVTAYYLDQSGKQTVIRHHLPTGLYRDDELKCVSEKFFTLDDGNCFGFMPYAWGKLYSANLLKQVVKKVDDRIWFAEDNDLLFRCVLSCTSMYISNIVGYHYVSREDSAVASKDDDFFSNLHFLYKSLKEVFSRQLNSDLLRIQLQELMVFYLSYAIRVKLGFDWSVQFSRFIPPYREHRNKRIIVYGGGEVGADYIKQLRRNPELECVLWVDSNWDSSKREWKKELTSPKEIAKTEYDEIWVAAYEDEIRDEIRQTLIEEYGVEEEKIFAEMPVIAWR